MKPVLAIIAAVLILALASLVGRHFYGPSSVQPSPSSSPSAVTPSSIAYASPSPSSSIQPSPNGPSPTPSATPSAVLVAPSLTSPGNDTKQNDRSIPLQWTAVTGADHYLVEVQFCNHQAACTDSNISELGAFSAPSSNLMLTQLKNYLDVNVRWRVSAVDAHGHPGPVSAWGRFEAVLSN